MSTALVAVDSERTHTTGDLQHSTGDAVPDAAQKLSDLALKYEEKRQQSVRSPPRTAELTQTIGEAMATARVLRGDGLDSETLNDLYWMGAGGRVVAMAVLRTPLKIEPAIPTGFELVIQTIEHSESGSEQYQSLRAPLQPTNSDLVS